MDVSKNSQDKSLKAEDKKRKQQKKRNQFKRQSQFHLMLIPSVILVFIFSYIPLYGIVIAFQNYNPALGFSSPWVGLDHFRMLFSQATFTRTIWNTLFMSTMKLAFGVFVPVTVAILLNEMISSKIKRFYQTLIYIPNFLSWVIMAGVLLDLLSTNGAVNNILDIFNIGPVSFLGNAKIFPWTMIFSDVWKSFGFGTVVYLAALTGIDPQLYEAADIDGATRWEKMKLITLPMLIPTVVLMTILAMGGVLNAGFDQVYNLYSPSVYSTGDIIDTYVFRLGIQQAQYSIGAAVGLFKSAVSMVLVLASYYIADRFAGYRVL